MANNNRRRGGFGYAPVNLTAPGTVFTLAIIALAIGFGILLSRGFVPSNILTEPPDKDVEVELVLETPMPGQRGLQLKTLKFKECSSVVTVDLLLDTSGSMNDRTPSGPTKLSRLKEAVQLLLGKARDDSVIGIQAFNTGNIQEVVPISYYRDVKATALSRVNALSVGAQTPTHDALAFSYQRLVEALPRFQDRKFSFIIISDGQPVPADQDPRLHSPNPADQIKALGVEVYSLGIFSRNQSDATLTELLRSIASKPENYFAASTGDDVQNLLNQISNKICAQAEGSLTPTPAS